MGTFFFPEANVQAITGTGDTALTYACENGHTDVADVLLQHGAVLVNKTHTTYTYVTLNLGKYTKSGYSITPLFL